MKTVYIPKGETVHYESLATERLVVHGRLHVTYGVKAQSITGSGVIDAGSINADTVCIDDVESGTVICKRLIAKRVQAPEVFASESAAVSCFLSAAFEAVGTGGGLRWQERADIRILCRRMCRSRQPIKPHSTAAFRWKTAMISSAIPLEIRERLLRIMRWAVMTL